MITPKAVIFGCSGHRLTAEERRFFAQHNPFGLILFARNIDNPIQLTNLVTEFRACVNRPDAPVLIDQEGGRVARLGPPHWPEYPAAAKLGEVYRKDDMRGIAAAKLLGRLLGDHLISMGITVDCTPVLDISMPDADPVMGNRCFDTDPKIVAVLARAVCDGLRVAGVLPVIKHMPGHGRTTADSHMTLPVVNASLDELDACDFVPFVQLADMPLAMTAHVLYPALDPDNCASVSSKIIHDVIREKMGFQGLLISDDIGMKALSTSKPVSARAVLAAGCDLVLECKGVLAEMQAVAEIVPPLSPAAQRRWEVAQKWLSPLDLFDRSLAEAEFNQLMSA